MESAAAQIRRWILDTAEAKGLGLDEWAVKAKVHRSTLFRAVKEDYEYVTSSRTLAKLAEAVGVERPQIGGAKSPIGSDLIELPIMYEVAAGAWRARDDINRDEPFGKEAVFRLAPYEAYPQWLERVVGDSYNKKVPDGSLIHVVDAIAMGYAPRHGDTVVVERRRGHFIERTLKEVVQTPDGVQLCPRSYNSKWSEPLDYSADIKPGEEAEVVIVAKVLRSYTMLDV